MYLNSSQHFSLQIMLMDLKIQRFFIEINEKQNNYKLDDEKKIIEEILNNFIKYYKSIPVDLQIDRYFDSILYHYKNIYLKLCFKI